VKKIRGSFCKTIKAPKSVFDRRSFRWKKSGKAFVLVGCKKGDWNAKAAKCATGTRAREVLVRTTGACRVGKRVKK
jgi:hypothetical protein